MTSPALHVGVGRADITPPLGTLLMGYGDPYGKRTAQSVRDPLHATALVLDDGQRKAALVSLDVIVVDEPQVEAIRAGVSRRTGIDAAHVTVCAIQTHSGPRTQRVWGWNEADTEYLDGIMVPGAIEAIAKADAARVFARVGFGETRSEVGINRRAVGEDHGVRLGQYPCGAFDPALTVLRFEGARGTVANLVHYGAHPTVMGGDSRVISRDWPGVMIDRMEQLTHAPTLFINGAVGDVAPRTNSLSAVGDGETSLWEVGSRASMDALRAWRAIKDLRDPPLRVLVDTLELPYRALTPREEAVQALAAAEARKGEPGAGMCEYRHWQAVVAAHDAPPQAGKRYRQVITALGPVAIVPFPGEPFAESVLRLRELSPFQHTLCASTSCGSNGYIWTREALARGGYEPWVGRAFGAYLLAQNIDDVLIERNLGLLRRLHPEICPPLA